jgi:uncharacterized low-complexity protein
MRVNSLRFFGRSIVGASLLALAIPAQAHENPPEVATKVASATEGGKAAGKDEKLICKRLPMTGSRVNVQRACHSKEDWKKLELNDD